jgi:serine/threonine-protein kinase
MNDNEKALHWLDLAFAEHASFLVQIAADPLYDGLRGNPRFQAMLRHMGSPGAN